MEMYVVMLVLGLVTGLYLGKIGENHRLRKSQHSGENYNWKGGSNQKKRAA